MLERIVLQTVIFWKFEYQKNFKLFWEKTVGRKSIQKQIFSTL